MEHLQKRRTAVRYKPMSAPPEWKTARRSGYKLKFLEPFKRFRGIEIPWDDVDALKLMTEHLAKASRSRKVVRLAAGSYGNPLDLYVKRYNFKTWYGPYLRAARKSRSREEFDLGWKLMKAGIKTPRPVWLAEASGALSPYSMFATEAIPASENVIERWKRLKREEDRIDLLIALGRFVRMLHEHRFYHDDCKAGHVLVLPDAPSCAQEFFIIDLLGCAIMKHLTEYRRAKNLYQILRSFKPKHTDFGFTPEHRSIFLNAYSESPEGAERWARWVARMGRLKGRIV